MALWEMYRAAAFEASWRLWAGRIDGENVDGPRVIKRRRQWLARYQHDEMRLRAHNKSLRAGANG